MENEYFASLSDFDKMSLSLDDIIKLKSLRSKGPGSVISVHSRCSTASRHSNRSRRSNYSGRSVESRNYTHRTYNPFFQRNKKKGFNPNFVPHWKQQYQHSKKQRCTPFKNNNGYYKNKVKQAVQTLMKRNNLNYFSRFQSTPLYHQNVRPLQYESPVQNHPNNNGFKFFDDLQVDVVNNNVPFTSANLAAFNQQTSDNYPVFNEATTAPSRNNRRRNRRKPWCKRHSVKRSLTKEIQNEIMRLQKVSKQRRGIMDATIYLQDYFPMPHVTGLFLNYRFSTYD